MYKLIGAFLTTLVLIASLSAAQASPERGHLEGDTVNFWEKTALKLD